MKSLSVGNINLRAAQLAPTSTVSTSNHLTVHELAKHHRAYQKLLNINHLNNLPRITVEVGLGKSADAVDAADAWRRNALALVKGDGLQFDVDLLADINEHAETRRVVHRRPDGFCS
jgi:hypothetical protein